MRQSYRGSFLTTEDGRFLGVNLGSDHCAEHEWGIKGIRRMFGMKDDAIGIDRLKIIGVAPNKLSWVKGEWSKVGKKKRVAKKDLVKYEGIHLDRYEKAGKPYGLSFFDSANPVWTGWSEDSFCIVSADLKQIEQLKELYKHFETNDIVVWRGGGGPFGGGGLVIAIASRISDEVVKNWRETDIESNAIAAEFKATGIEEKLKAAGKGYFALAPSRQEDGSLIYWLNPNNQRSVNYGWFTLSDLEDWLKDEGKIPMTPSKMEERNKR